MPWEHFSHQADMGIRGRGASKEEAFEQAAMALTAVITDPNKVEQRASITVQRDDADDELLFADWINASFMRWRHARCCLADFASCLPDRL